MNIEKLLSTKERVKILDNVIYLEKKFGVNEIAKKLSLSKGFVSKYFEILFGEGILKKKENKFVVDDNSLIKSLRIMLNIQKNEPRIFRKYKFVRAAGLYGSSAKGTNTEHSDVDLWIKADEVGDSMIVELTSELRKKIENIKILMLSDKKLKILKQKDPLFYYSLYFGSIILYGGENEI